MKQSFFQGATKSSRRLCSRSGSRCKKQTAKSEIGHLRGASICLINCRSFEIFVPKSKKCWWRAIDVDNGSKATYMYSTVRRRSISAPSRAGRTNSMNNNHSDPLAPRTRIHRINQNTNCSSLQQVKLKVKVAHAEPTTHPSGCCCRCSRSRHRRLRLCPGYSYGIGPRGSPGDQEQSSVGLWNASPTDANSNHCSAAWHSEYMHYEECGESADANPHTCTHHWSRHYSY